jgi:hypothetical protein
LQFLFWLIQQRVDQKGLLSSIGLKE